MGRKNPFRGVCSSSLQEPSPAKLLAGADTLCPDEVRILLTCCYQLKDNEVQDFNLIVAAGQQLVVRGLPLVPDRLGPGQLSMLELSQVCHLSTEIAVLCVCMAARILVAF
jgi:hypothetical protein